MAGTVAGVGVFGSFDLVLPPWSTITWAERYFATNSGFVSRNLEIILSIQQRRMRLAVDSRSGREAVELARPTTATRGAVLTDEKSARSW